jgi:hypothetical protein
MGQRELKRGTGHVVFYFIFEEVGVFFVYSLVTLVNYHIDTVTVHSHNKLPPPPEKTLQLPSADTHIKAHHR